MQYGRLAVLSERGIRGGHRVFRVRCDCGQEKEIDKQAVLKGRTRSCGCLGDAVRRAKARTHGMSGTQTYNIWTHILRRCTNAKSQAYRWYGGRGIKVCRRWRRFENFFADMGPCPKGKTLDRIDVNGDYEPSNCRWATRAEQARNTTRTIFITVGGQRLCLTDWAKLIGVKPSAMFAARARGDDLAAYITRRTP